MPTCPQSEHSRASTYSVAAGSPLGALGRASSSRQRVVPAHAGGRLKQWLMLLRRHAPQAETLYQQLRPIKAAEDIDAHLIASGVLPPDFIAEVLDAG